MLRERGAHAGGEALEGPEAAVVVRPGPEPIVTDGPFAETKEAIGGFYLVECASRDEALELAAEGAGQPWCGCRGAALRRALSPGSAQDAREWRQRANAAPARRNSPPTPFGRKNITRMRTIP